MITPTEIAWAAGLFEGEGCINVQFSPKRNRPIVRLTLRMTDEDVVRKFAVLVGAGRVHGPYRKKNPKHKPAWNWSWYGRDALAWADANFGPFLGSRRGATLKEAIRIEETSPYHSEGFRRWARGIESSTRVCSNCESEKPMSDFSGSSSWCKVCQANAATERRQRTADKRWKGPEWLKMIGPGESYVTIAHFDRGFEICGYRSDDFQKFDGLGKFPTLHEACGEVKRRYKTVRIISAASDLMELAVS
jgi:hypothetical protein